ncbi:MAG: hypothetical protein N4A71_05690 [Carboxylicivirga sp.]|jgi:lysozyme family protein|nr:hypothetical protein [Carboxylicivirga sp.]
MFEQALKTVLKHEGYYVNNANDKGGETYRGIARNFHPNWIGWGLVDQEKTFFGGRLNRNQKVDHPLIEKYVADFYKRKFWDRIYLDLVKDPNLQLIIFDAYVNAGGNGIKTLQMTLNRFFGKNLKVDGAQGKLTVAAINSVNPQQLFTAYKGAREDYYKNIAHGKNAIFLKGWLNRIKSFNYKAVGISAGLLLGLGIGTFFL